MPEPDHDPTVPHGYRILHRLGSGQTANVHLARHARYGKVALKLPRPEIEERPVLRRMFENEVMITLRLDHPHVVRGLDGHPTGSGAYLALEMCSGGTLDQALLERGRLPLSEAIRLVSEVAEGLAYAHGRKVLHRDVKPANVFLDDGGRAKLGDFGTGVFFGADDAERVGTAFYMAPEIFEGGASTVRSDVYALGVLAYEVLTGQRPFRGETFDALMHAHLGGLLRDPASLRPELPKEAARVVRTALARLPARRHDGVDAFLTAWYAAGASQAGTAAGAPAAAGPRDPEGRPDDAPPAAGRKGRGRRAETPSAGAAGPEAEASDRDRADAERDGAGRSWWRRLWGGSRDE